MQTPSIRGRVFHRSLRVVSAPAGLGRILPAVPLADLWPRTVIDIADWHESVGHNDEQTSRVIAMAWSRSRRHDRLYLFAAAGAEPGLRFYKLALNQTSWSQYERESEFQGQLGAYKTFQRPRFLRSIQSGSVLTLEYEALPRTARAVSPYCTSYRAIVDEFAQSQHRLRLTELIERNHWNIEDPIIEQTLTAVDRTLPGHAFRASCGHGDIAPANLLTAGSQKWLVDWEEASLHLPWLVDRLSCELAFKCGLRQGRGSPPSIGQASADDASREFSADIALALVHRHHHGHPEAADHLQNWRTRW
jgi:hypothetical protein